jgi:hypothetical protein
VEFLGHIVSAEGIQADGKKVKAVEEWPPPTDVHQVRSFFGLVSFYRKFVPHFAEKAASMTDLLRKGVPFLWGEKQAASFAALKQALVSDPVLASPDTNLPFVVHVDASGFALGAVLQQDQGRGLQPVAYESRKMLPAETRYPVHEQECLGIVHALKKWRHLLQSSKFELHTDHYSLKYLLTQPTLSHRQARWLDLLQEFAPNILYVPGPDNVVADALSRRVDLAALQGVSVTSTLMDRVRAAYDAGPYFSDPKKTRVLREVAGLRYFGNRLVIPKDARLRQDIILEHHNPEHRGHLGCQRNKPTNTHPAGLLQPLPIPDKPWDSMSMDLITDPPVCASGFDAFVVFVDRLTKAIVVAPTHKTVTAPQLAHIFVDTVYRRYGLPRTHA